MSSIRIRTRKDGSAYSQVLFRHHGKQTSESFDDHAAALEWQGLLDLVGPDEALDILTAAQQATHAVRTLTEASADYIDNLTGVTAGTRHQYRRYLRNDINEFMGALPVTAITEKLVGRWVNHLADNVGNAPTTIANKHGFLYALMKSMVKTGEITTGNPCKDTRLPRVDPAEMCFLEADDSPRSSPPSLRTAGDCSCNSS